MIWVISDRLAEHGVRCLENRVRVPCFVRLVFCSRFLTGCFVQCLMICSITCSSVLFDARVCRHQDDQLVFAALFGTHLVVFIVVLGEHVMSDVVFALPFFSRVLFHSCFFVWVLMSAAGFDPVQSRSGVRRYGTNGLSFVLFNFLSAGEGFERLFDTVLPASALLFVFSLRRLCGVTVFLRLSRFGAGFWYVWRGIPR